MLYLLSFAIFAFASAYDCDDCSNNCRFWYQRCYWNKLNCRWAGIPVVTFLSVTESLCKSEVATEEDEKMLAAAQDVLVEKGYFARADFQDREVKFCPLLGGGVTVSEQKMIIDDSYRNKSTLELAGILAHEMFHAKCQFEKLGFDTFACLYRAELEKGSGTGRENAMEKPAYGFEEGVENCLFKGQGCPISSPSCDQQR